MGVSRSILHQNVPMMSTSSRDHLQHGPGTLENISMGAYGAYAHAMIDLNGRLDADQVAKIDRIPEVICARGK